MLLYALKYIKYTYFLNKYMQKRVINIKKKCMNSFECVFKITLLENTQLLNMEKKKNIN